MKKEIKALLASDDSTLKINEMFSLHRWKLNKDTDFLGREGDYLELVMNAPSYCSQSVRIESRDLPGIITEVEKAMKSMLNYYTYRLVINWHNGYIG